MLRQLALAAALATATVPLQATTYTLEPDYTQGVFRWNHLGFSSPAAQFAQGQGALEFDPADPTNVRVVKIGANPRTGLPTVGFDGTTTLKRSDFGLGRYVPQVGDDIEMHIICQAVDARAYAEYLKAHPKN
jgi:polyisoprenoid-binding protein YceI